MAVRIRTTLVIMVLAWNCTGCAVVTLARGGQGGADVTGIQPGTAQAAAEAVLGAPVREWRSPAGVRYRTYEYDSGCPPSPGGAAAFMVMNIVSVGLWEVFTPLYKFTRGKDPLDCPKHTTDRIVVAYDDHDVVLGLFDEWAELAADGRSGPRKWK